MATPEPTRPTERGEQAAELVARLSAIVWEADGLDLRMTFVSPRALDLLGHDPAAWRDTPGFWSDHIHADDRERVLAAIQRTGSAGGGTVRTRYRFRHADGGDRWFQDSISVVVHADSSARLSGLMVDVTEDHGEGEVIAAGQVAAEAVASRTGALHESIVDNLNDGVYYVDRERRISYWNRGAERLTGYRASEVVGRQCFENILCHVDSRGSNLCKDGCPLKETMQDGASRNMVIWLRRADGSRLPVETRTAPIRAADASIIGCVEIFNDATDLIEAQDAAAAARRDALTDPLTGLPNRRLMDAVLASRKNDLDRSGRRFGLLIVDVDHFKVFNDRFGHDVGDVALRIVAATLRGGVRGGDTLVRWGGEEFAVVAAITDEDGMPRLAERLLALIRTAQVRAGEKVLSVRVSIGGATAEPGEGVDQLFARADQALLRAKQGGRDRFVLDATGLRSAGPLGRRHAGAAERDPGSIHGAPLAPSPSPTGGRLHAESTP